MSREKRHKVSAKCVAFSSNCFAERSSLRWVTLNIFPLKLDIRRIRLFKVLLNSLEGNCLIWRCDLFGRRQLKKRVNCYGMPIKDFSVVGLSRENFKDFRKIDFTHFEMREIKVIKRICLIWNVDALFAICSIVWIFRHVKFLFPRRPKIGRLLPRTEKVSKIWNVTSLEQKQLATFYQARFLSVRIFFVTTIAEANEKFSSVSLIIKHAIFKWKHHKISVARV